MHACMHACMGVCVCVCPLVPQQPCWDTQIMISAAYPQAILLYPHSSWSKHVKTNEIPCSDFRHTKSRLWQHASPLRLDWLDGRQSAKQRQVNCRRCCKSNLALRVDSAQNDGTDINKNSSNQKHNNGNHNNLARTVNPKMEAMEVLYHIRPYFAGIVLSQALYMVGTSNLGS